MTIRKVSSSEWVEDKTGSTLAARDYKDSGDLVVEQPAVLMTMREGKPGGGKGPLLSEEQSLTLATGNGQTLFQPQAFRKSKRARSDSDDESGVDDGGANTLNVFDSGDTRTTHAIVEPQAVPMINMQGSKSNSVAQGDGPSYTLTAMHGHDVHAILEPSAYGVRRLTPVECERLQSFPDGWTEPAGSDSARYKAMGNAVTVNVVRWILNRMVQAG